MSSSVKYPFGRTALVLGGARSGKSRFAEELCTAEAGARKIYIATAEARDAEMRARIERHRSRRGADWLTIEEPLDLPEVIRAHGGAESILLVDCLTLWLSNLLEAQKDIATETEGLLAALSVTEGHAVLVSNEVGLAIVPDNAPARQFRDQAGWLNQEIASAADSVYFIAAGLPLVLKTPKVKSPDDKSRDD